jgi:AbiU2
MEKESMAIFSEDIWEMNERVIELSRSYAILWVFWDSENNKHYSGVIKDHQDFFYAIGSSLFQGFCIITYQLFDKRGDVKSLPDLINYLTSLDQKLEQQLKSKIDSQRPLLDKFFSFRHKIYAHRDKSKRPWEVFGNQSKTRIKSEMKAIVDLAQEIISAMAEAAGIEKDEFVENLRLREDNAGIDATEVLKALEKAGLR